MSNNPIENITILYEDKDCLVINKPAGIMVHSDGRASGPFITDWITKHYPTIVGVGDVMTGQDGEEINRAGIVHRLDRETSGALIIAKTNESHAHLKKQFQDRTISKKYVAFIWGEMKENFGTITRSIGRSKSDFRKYSAQRGAKGDMKEAETYWTKLATSKAIVESIADKKGKTEKVEEKFSYIEVEPKTGRTHQIRVHFNAINHPIVADSLYAPKRPRVLGFERLALHSKSIEFEMIESKRIKVEAPLPEDFVQGLRVLGIESLVTI